MDATASLSSPQSRQIDTLPNSAGEACNLCVVLALFSLLVHFRRLSIKLRDLLRCVLQTLWNRSATIAALLEMPVVEREMADRTFMIRGG